MTDQENVLRTLHEYASKDLYALHMPGHKRNEAGHSAALPFGLDVTEIGPFDPLHAPDGLLLGAMSRAASLYRTRQSHFLVNGASGGILAGLRTLFAGHRTAVVAQNSHRSVFHALELCQIMPKYVLPEADDRYGLWGGVSAEKVALAMDRAGGAVPVVMTSPSYEGTISDISAIAKVVHSRGGTLFVDEAHGAHIPFRGDGGQSAIRCGADLVVQSLHKTLPSLTQTAILHAMSPRVDLSALQRQLSVFETSSPSFILLASMDECVGTMARQGRALVTAHDARLRDFSAGLRGLKGLRVRGFGDDEGYVPPGSVGIDPWKIWIDAGGMGGAALSQLLLNEWGIVMEMAMGSGALGISTFCDKQGTLGRLSAALRGVAVGSGAKPFPIPPPLTQQMPIGEALSAEAEWVDLAKAVGRIGAEYVWAYPPGVPVMVPGALVGEGVLSAQLHSTSGRMAEKKVKVLRIDSGAGNAL